MIGWLGDRPGGGVESSRFVLFLSGRKMVTSLATTRVN